MSGPLARIFASLVTVLPLAGLPSTATPLQIELIRLVDSATPVPGTDDVFFLDRRAPSICNLGVVFIGNRESTFASGIYTISPSGTLRTLVDESDQIPGRDERFRRIDDLSCAENRVVFRSRNTAPGAAGNQLELYEWTPEGVRSLAGATFQGISEPKATANATAFAGFMSGTTGVYLQTAGDPLQALVTTVTPVPELGISPRTLSMPDIGSAEVLSFATYDDDSGAIFRKALLAMQGDQIRVVASPVTPVPDSPTAEFLNVTPGAIWEEQILFGAATSESGPALYLEQDGLLEVLLPHDTPLPGNNSVESVDFVDTDRGIHGFLEGQDAPFERVLYLVIDDTIVRVLGNGDTLDGQVVSDIRFALEDGQLALWVLFTDGSQAIYAASLLDAAPPLDVPGPGTLGLGLLALLLAGSGTLWLRLS